MKISLSAYITLKKEARNKLCKSFTRSEYVRGYQWWWNCRCFIYCNWINGLRFPVWMVCNLHLQ